jgi:hypothetical protein
METPGQVFACTSGANLNATLTCLGDEGPNRTRPAKGAPASTIWWENDARCGEVVLDGTGKSKLPCQYAGDCAYTAPLSAQTASKGVAEACAPIPCRQSDAAIKARCAGWLVGRAGCCVVCAFGDRQTDSASMRITAHAIAFVGAPQSKSHIIATLLRRRGQSMAGTAHH